MVSVSPPIGPTSSVTRASYSGGSPLAMTQPAMAAASVAAISIQRQRLRSAEKPASPETGSRELEAGGAVTIVLSRHQAANPRKAEQLGEDVGDQQRAPGQRDHREGGDGDEPDRRDQARVQPQAKRHEEGRRPDDDPVHPRVAPLEGPDSGPPQAGLLEQVVDDERGAGPDSRPHRAVS